MLDSILEDAHGAMFEVRNSMKPLPTRICCELCQSSWKATISNKYSVDAYAKLLRQSTQCFVSPPAHAELTVADHHRMHALERALSLCKTEKFLENMMQRLFVVRGTFCNQVCSELEDAGIVLREELLATLLGEKLL